VGAVSPVLDTAPTSSARGLHHDADELAREEHLVADAQPRDGERVLVAGHCGRAAAATPPRRRRSVVGPVSAAVVADRRHRGGSGGGAACDAVQRRQRGGGAAVEAQAARQLSYDS